MLETTAEKSRQLETLNAQLITQLDEKSKTMTEVTNQLTDSIDLLSEKDKYCKQLLSSISDYEAEIDLMKGENEKAQLALDLTRANLAMQQTSNDGDCSLNELKEKMEKKDEIINELKTELEQRNDDFNKLEDQVEHLG